MYSYFPASIHLLIDEKSSTTGRKSSALASIVQYDKATTDRMQPSLRIYCVMTRPHSYWNFSNRPICALNWTDTNLKFRVYLFLIFNWTSLH